METLESFAQLQYKHIIITIRIVYNTTPCLLWTNSRRDVDVTLRVCRFNAVNKIPYSYYLSACTYLLAFPETYPTKTALSLTARGVNCLRFHKLEIIISTDVQYHSTTFHKHFTKEDRTPNWCPTWPPAASSTVIRDSVISVTIWGVWVIPRKWRCSRRQLCGAKMVFEYERVRCVVGEAGERCSMISNFWSLKKNRLIV
jgi:hypothetical protein